MRISALDALHPHHIHVIFHCSFRKFLRQGVHGEGMKNHILPEGVTISSLITGKAGLFRNGHGLRPGQYVPGEATGQRKRCCGAKRNQCQFRAERGQETRLIEDVSRSILYIVA